MSANIAQSTRLSLSHFLNLATLELEPNVALPRQLTPREERGRSLALAGAVHAHGPFFVVAGSNAERYFLRFEEAAGRYVCECGDWTWRIEGPIEDGRQPVDRCCKHGFAIEHAIANGLVVNASGGE